MNILGIFYPFIKPTLPKSSSREQQQLLGEVANTVDHKQYTQEYKMYCFIDKQSQ